MRSAVVRAGYGSWRDAKPAWGNNAKSALWIGEERTGRDLSRLDSFRKQFFCSSRAKSAGEEMRFTENLFPKNWTIVPDENLLE